MEMVLYLSDGPITNLYLGSTWMNKRDLEDIVRNLSLVSLIMGTHVTFVPAGILESKKGHYSAGTLIVDCG